MFKLTYIDQVYKKIDQLTLLVIVCVKLTNFAMETCSHGGGNR